jgi:hypothetical protein
LSSQLADEVSPLGFNPHNRLIKTGKPAVRENLRLSGTINHLPSLGS